MRLEGEQGLDQQGITAMSQNLGVMGNKGFK